MFVANHLEFYSDSSGLWLLSWYILSGERAYVLEVALPFSLLGEKAVVWAMWSSHNHVSGEFGFWSVVCENEQLVPNTLSCSTHDNPFSFWWWQSVRYKVDSIPPVLDTDKHALSTNDESPCSDATSNDEKQWAIDEALEKKAKLTGPLNFANNIISRNGWLVFFITQGHWWYTNTGGNHFLGWSVRVEHLLQVFWISTEH